MRRTARIVAISDTHGHLPSHVPDGDVLVNAGDFCKAGSMNEVRHFCAWLQKQPHAHKVVVPGNHDLPLQNVRHFGFTRENHRRAVDMVSRVAHLLIDSGVCLRIGEDGAELNFWGSPWQPALRHQWAFELPRGCDALKAKWQAVPASTDVLVTHAPPLGIGDATEEGEHLGCAHLLERVRAIRPMLHVFGHIHPGHGVYAGGGGDGDGVVFFVNASLCDDENQLVNKPVGLEIMRCAPPSP